jgi:hypothetical protein
MEEATWETYMKMDIININIIYKGKGTRNRLESPEIGGGGELL